MILKILFFPITLVCYALIYFYKFVISPLLPNTCIYQPTCSTYALTAIKQHGLVKGLWLGLKRLTKCRPKYAGGLDLVPLNIKGDKKWIF